MTVINFYDCLNTFLTPNDYENSGKQARLRLLVVPCLSLASSHWDCHLRFKRPWTFSSK